MLKVVGGEAVEDEVDGRSLLDEIARPAGNNGPPVKRACRLNRLSESRGRPLRNPSYGTDRPCRP